VPNPVGVTMIVDNVQLKKSFDEDIKLLADMTRATDQFNKSAVEGARGAIEAQKEYGKELGASSDQMRRLDAISTQLETKVSAAGDRMATSAERGARGLSVMARQGTVTARSMNQLIAAGADIAFAFGPEGTIISAVLMVTAGIVAHFESVDSKIEETIAKFNHSLDDMLLNDSPIELAKASAKAYIDQLEAQGELVAAAKKAAMVRSLGTGAPFGLDALTNWYANHVTGTAEDKVKTAAAEGSAADVASALLAPIHARDKEIDRLKDEEKRAAGEVTTWREKVDALKSDGKTAELKVARHELADLTGQRDAARKRINELEQSRINTADAIVAKMTSPREAAAAFAIVNPIKDRGLTDFSEEDQHSDATASSARAARSIAAITKSNAERDRLRKERADAERRANEMMGQMQDAAVQHLMQAHGLIDEAEKAAIDREFNRRADEIDHLKVSEDRKAELLIAAAIDRTNAVEAIQRRSGDRLRDEIAREANDAVREYQKGEEQKQRAIEQSARVLEQVGTRMADDLVRGREDLGRRLLKAAMEPEIMMLQGWAKSQFVQAAKDFAIQDYIGGAEHMLGGTLLMAGAAELGSLAGGSGGGAGGGGGGGSGGGSSSATHLGATGNQQSGPLMVQFVVVHQDANGREMSRTAQQLQRLDDRNVPIRIGAVG